MPKISINVPHELGQDEAARRLSGLMDAIRNKYKDQIKDLEETMDGHSGTFSFKTMGLKVTGAVEVGETEAAIDCDLPFAAMMFKGKIEGEIRKQVERLLKS